MDLDVTPYFLIFFLVNIILRLWQVETFRRACLGEVGIEAIEGLLRQQQEEVDAFREQQAEAGSTRGYFLHFWLLRVRHKLLLIAEIAASIWDRTAAIFSSKARINDD